MTFRIGDRVTNIKKGNSYYDRYEIGTIVEIITNPSIFGDNSSPWCYVSWDKATEDTFAHKFSGVIYRHVYGFYASSLELVKAAKVKASDPRLPTDPRLLGIALKIRDLENKYKSRHDSAVYQNKERILSDFQRSKVCTG